MASTQQQTSIAPDRGHAIVIGASMAGLAAARALSDRFARVTVLDRDHLPAAPRHRKGVPHGRQLHVLLSRGLQALDAMLPGLADELIAAGAQQIDVGREFRILYRSGWAPTFDADLHMLAFTRPLLEAIVRQRIAALPNVAIRSAQPVTGLLTDADRRRITGVRTTDRTLEADFVVDASGRRSRTPDLLDGLGFGRPAETVVDAHWGYASRMYRKPAHSDADWKQLLVMFAAPEHKRVGVLQPVEGDRWLVNLAGVMGDHPPTDEAGFLAFACSLRSRVLYDAIREAEPIGPIHGYRNTENRLRHYERMRQWPDRLIVVGDAACAFNPVYGQGITVAALEAEALSAALAPPGRLDGRARKFQRHLARIVRGPFQLATGEDSRWPGADGAYLDRATRIMHWYVDRVIDRIPGDADLYLRFQRVGHLLAPPTSLLAPAAVWRVLRRAGAERSVSDQQVRRARVS